MVHSPCSCRQRRASLAPRVLLWTVSVGGGPTAVAVAERSGHIFVGNSNADTVSMLDARTGPVLRTARMEHSPRAVAVDDRTGRVVVLSRGIDDAYVPPIGLSGTVSALDARTGTVLHTVAVGVGPRAIAVDERRGRVFVANTRSNSVSVLDAGSGALLRTVVVGAGPSAAAVDERIGKVFVSTLGDDRT